MPAKLFIYPHGDPDINQYWFYCPGCGNDHAFTVGPQKEGWGTARWTFNGNLESPTFTPSLLCNPGSLPNRCHSFVTDGRIQFLSDCWHKLAGQTVDLPDYEDKP